MTLEAIIPLVHAINAHESRMRQYSGIDLAAQTLEFRERLHGGASLDEIELEAFAVVREASRRILNLRHADMHLVAGLVLHRGRVAEVDARGENALVVMLSGYLHALEGKGVHVIAINDRTAKRDYEQMGRVYRALGVSVGLVGSDSDDGERARAYGASVTYGSFNEFALDYLRDNTKSRTEHCVQRPPNFAIIDEVDAILIDEASNPLILTSPGEESTDKYCRVNIEIPKLVHGDVVQGAAPGERYTTGDYTVDEKHRYAALTEEGVLKLEKLLNVGTLYDPQNIEWNHHAQQALRAHVVYQRDRDYVVRDSDDGGEVLIVNEFTGRPMPGRRWKDGLHQAIEAKEGVKIQRETLALGTITVQNYFRMYGKLAGITSTAVTDVAEFEKMYRLEVVVVPTNCPVIRKQNMDVVYRTEVEKLRNAAKEIQQYNAKGQPVLVGTITVEKSEWLSNILKKMVVGHEILNAKNQEREASILAQAGRKGAVTVTTQMVYRGPNILLGGDAEFMARDECLKRKIAERLTEEKGHYIPDELFYYFTHNEQFYRVRRDLWDEVFIERKAFTDQEHDEVVALGGLHLVATERNGSRRMDQQFRGIAGRQGDPGSSRFFLSLQDDLLRVLGGERMQQLMLELGMQEDVPIESALITKRIGTEQQAVEARSAYAGKDPLVEYKKEAHKLFAAMMDRIEDDTVRYLFLAQAGNGAAPVQGVLKRFWSFLTR